MKRTLLSLLISSQVLSGCKTGLFMRDVTEVVPATVAVGNGTFAVSGAYATGSTPYLITKGDFNGDGKPDVASANYGDGTISVLLGNGDGTFQNKIDTISGASTFSIVSGDFNHDGKLDIAVSRWGGFASILIGNGNGTFAAPVDYVVGTASFDIYKIVAADFNGDGNLDLAVATSWTASVAVLLGNADGTFQPQVQYTTTVGAVVGLDYGDLNGDGKIDLVATRAGTTCVMFLGNGDGTFQAAVPTPATGGWTEWVFLSDLNGDGKLDIVGTNGLGNANLAVVLGNGDGTFQAATMYPFTGDPDSVVFKDFNADGKVDMAVAVNNSGSLAVMLGNGDGTFQAPQETIVGANLYSMVMGDFDGDTLTDIAISDISLSVIHVLLGN